MKNLFWQEAKERHNKKASIGRLLYGEGTTLGEAHYEHEEEVDRRLATSNEIEKPHCHKKQQLVHECK